METLAWLDMATMVMLGCNAAWDVFSAICILYEVDACVEAARAPQAYADADDDADAMREDSPALRPRRPQHPAPGWMAPVTRAHTGMWLAPPPLTARECALLAWCVLAMGMIRSTAAASPSLRFSALITYVTEGSYIAAETLEGRMVRRRGAAAAALCVACGALVVANIQLPCPGDGQS